MNNLAVIQEFSVPNIAAGVRTSGERMAFNQMCDAKWHRSSRASLPAWLNRCLIVAIAICLMLSLGSSALFAQTTLTAAGEKQTDEAKSVATKNMIGDFVGGGPNLWTSREGLTSSLQIMLLLTVLSIAPAILLMTTCFVRIIVVLGLLRQAIGTQQLPPSQVITAIALFMTALVMTPVWSDVYHDAIAPYTDPASEMSLEEAWNAGSKPIRRFMSRQIDMAGNSDDVWMFYEYLPKKTLGAPPKNYDEVPLQVLFPAFMLSELKTSFLIGFQIYLPFLILDIVIASVTISMGMMMLPPVMISLPFKLMLFVLLDGWRLVVGMLLESFAPYG